MPVFSGFTKTTVLLLIIADIAKFQDIYVFGVTL